MKLSHPELLPLPQSDDPEGALTWPVQVTFGFDSETVPEDGLAPRVIGIITIAAATAHTQTSAASMYRDRMILEINRVSVSLLNISASPFLHSLKMT